MNQEQIIKNNKRRENNSIKKEKKTREKTATFTGNYLKCSMPKEQNRAVALTNETESLGSSSYSGFSSERSPGTNRFLSSDDISTWNSKWRFGPCLFVFLLFCWLVNKLCISWWRMLNLQRMNIRNASVNGDYKNCRKI